MLAVSLTDFSEANVTALAKGCLAVAGGFLAGYVLGALSAYGFDKFIAKRESPHGLHKVVRFTCALIAAIIVALLMFRGGSGGNGGDGTGGAAQGDRTGGTGTEATTANPTGTLATKPEPTPAKIQIVDVIFLKVFGGDDVEAKTENYFQVGDESVDGRAVKVDLKGVKDRVEKKPKPAKGNLLIVYDFAPTASKRTAGGITLLDAKDSLGAPLLPTEEYQKLLAKQP